MLLWALAWVAGGEGGLAHLSLSERGPSQELSSNAQSPAHLWLCALTVETLVLCGDPASVPTPEGA